jgi:hypothetical protein
LLLFANFAIHKSINGACGLLCGCRSTQSITLTILESNKVVLKTVQITQGAAMKSETKINLDYTFPKNPDISTKANTFYKFFMPFLGLCWIIVGIVNLQSDGTLFFSILQIILGSILLLVILFQTTFYKKFGRLYIHFGTDSLELKKTYFKPMQKIAWGEISKIKIQNAKFRIIKDNDQNDVVTFNVQYAKNGEIRQLFRTFARLKGFDIEE